jgi:hypothetical protein
VPVLRMLGEPAERRSRAAERLAELVGGEVEETVAASAAARCRSPSCRASRARSRSRSRARCAPATRRSSASSATEAAARLPHAHATTSSRGRRAVDAARGERALAELIGWICCAGADDARLAIVAELRADALATARARRRGRARVGADPTRSTAPARARERRRLRGEERGVFANTPLRALLEDGEAAFAHSSAASSTDARRRSTPARTPFAEAFGTDFWRWLEANPPSERLRPRDGGGKDRRRAPRAVGWSGDETVVDVGGGNGALLVALVSEPGCAGSSSTCRDRRDEAALGDRVEFVAGSFFERVPEGTRTSSRDPPRLGRRARGAILRTIRRPRPSGAAC